MKYEPHPYQQRALDFLHLPGNRNLYLDMGLGKTVITATYIDQYLRRHPTARCLIVAPLRVATSTWPSEFKKWDHLQTWTVAVAAGQLQKKRNAIFKDFANRIVLLNYESLTDAARTLTLWPFDLVVFDEVSKMKDASTQRFRAFRRRLDEIDKIIGLTGTPCPNGYMDLWAPMFMTDRGARLGRTLTSFRERWFRQVMGGRDGANYASGYTPLPSAEIEIPPRIADVCMSMSADDYLTLPDRLDNTISVALPPDAEALYRRLESDMFLELSDLETVTAVSAAVVSMKCRQAAAGAFYLDGEERKWKKIHEVKLDALDQIVEEASGEPILVAVNFRFEWEMITGRYRFARPMTRDPQVITDWNAGKIRMLVANPQSAGMGINLQQGGHIIAWYGLTWSLGDYLQFNARLHRQGQGHPVMVHHIVAEKTVDEMVVRALQSKRNAQDLLLEAVKERIQK